MTAGHRYFLFARDSTVSYGARGTLAVLMDVGHPMTVAELTAMGSDPEPVVVDYLSELVSAGYVGDDPGGVWAPTARAFEAGTDGV